MAIKRNLTISLIEIFLLELLYLSSLTFGAPSNVTVLDIDGHEVLANTKYQIVPAPGFDGGGIVLSSRHFFQPCPLNVAQASEKHRGFPVMFFPADPKQQNIQLSHDINIQSMTITFCMRSDVWEIRRDADMKPKPTIQWYLSTNGVVGDPGPETVRNWFKIEKGGSGEGYKIVFCPSVCEKCEFRLCEDVGVFDEDGDWWLGLGGRKLSVVFNKTGEEWV